MIVARLIACAIASAMAWLAGMFVIFGPAQKLLADPSLQSLKFLAVFNEEPLPKMVEQPQVIVVGLLLVGLFHATVYSWLAPRLPGNTVRRGVTFGAIAWALMVPWFEFYLPYNVMHEPLPLALLEAACWFVVLQGVGLAIAAVHNVFVQRADA